MQAHARTRVLFQRCSPQRQYNHSQHWCAWRKPWSLTAPLQNSGSPSPIFPGLTDLTDDWEELRSWLPASLRSQTYFDRKSWGLHNSSSQKHPNLYVVRHTDKPNNIYINKPAKISSNRTHQFQYRLKKENLFGVLEIACLPWHLIQKKKRNTQILLLSLHLSFSPFPFSYLAGKGEYLDHLCCTRCIQCKLTKATDRGRITTA